MFFPQVRPGIEEPNKASRALHDRSNVAAFRSIAEGTGICQIISVGLPTVLFADDVINLAAKEGVLFVDQAVFTEVFCPRGYESAQGRVNVAAHEPDGHGHEP